MRLFILLAVVLLTVPCLAGGARWTDLARKVGSSEEGRVSVIRQLRRMPGLESQLTQALTTKDRPLALEVICDLELKSFVPRLLPLVANDADGFLTLALNSLMDEKNRDSILRTYSPLLGDIRYRSPSSILAMLEPIGRLGKKLPRGQLISLKNSVSPEVREGVLYYLRIMAVRHSVFENTDLIESLARDPSRQIQEHARVVLTEIRTPKLAVTQ